MTEKYSYKDAIINHRESSRKFDYFLLGVTLAFLAFSLERFDTLNSYNHIWMIIISWILLLVSFLAGLYRQEGIIIFLQTEIDKIKYKPRHDVFKENVEGHAPFLDEKSNPWTKEEMNKEYEQLKKAMTIIDGRIGKYGNRVIYAYSIQKWSFVTGLLLTAVFKITNI